MNAVVEDIAGLGVVAVVVVALLVAVGSLVPVIPTGTLVSAAAALAVHADVPVLAVGTVLVSSAVGALVGDVGLHSLSVLARSRGRVRRWLDKRSDSARMARAEKQLQAHSMRLLVVSRLLPGGRVPVILAAAAVDLSLRSYLTGAAVAALVWSAVYSALGIVTAAGFDDPTQSVVASIAVVTVVSVVAGLVQRRRDAKTQ